MKFKWLLVVLIIYVLALMTNLMPSLKYPDTTTNVFHLMNSLVLLIMVVLLAFKPSIKGKSLSIFKAILFVGSLSGVIVFIIHTVENYAVNHALLDIISSIQYPLYLIFTTPFFGINHLFQLNYEIFSLFMSAVYLIILIIIRIK